MCESIVVVGAALSADVDAPTERVHSAPVDGIWRVVDLVDSWIS